MKPAPTVSTNIIEATPAPPAHQYQYCIPEPAPDSQEAFLGEVTAQDLEELCLLDTVAVSSLKRAEELHKCVRNAMKAKSGSGFNNRTGNKAADIVPSPSPSNNSPVSQTSSPPSGPPVGTSSAPHAQTAQFHYTTPIEDPTLVQKVIEKGLESTVMLTQRELYAISPDVRCFIKDQVTTKWVPVNTTAVSAFKVNEPVEALLNHSTLPTDIIVANPVEDLCTIQLRIEGTVDVNAILDEGSQIIGIQHNLWEKLGVPM